MQIGSKPVARVTFGNHSPFDPDVLVKHEVDSGIRQMESFLNRTSPPVAGTAPDKANAPKRKFWQRKARPSEGANGSDGLVKKSADKIRQNKVASLALAGLVGLGLFHISTVEELQQSSQQQVGQLQESLTAGALELEQSGEQIDALQEQLANTSGDRTELRTALAELQEEYDAAALAWADEKKELQAQISQLQLEVNKKDCDWVIVC